ncbi:MAG: hypothetical protein NT048_04015 [Flavobacterium sp.]|nr:hypothetical protein [Flavobacterium sp.]
MKKLFTLIALIASITTFAQAPQGFNYQATVRNAAGDLIINQNVTFKFNIMLNTSTSLPVFSETHYVPTDDLGQVNLTVGEGTATTGTFAAIDWGTGNYYLGIELKTGANFVAMGTTQLLSVPYALYANSSGSTQTHSKTSIYLTGDITDAQAAAKLATELGPDTENIYIRNTTQLTNVDLSSLVTAVKISLENNVALANVNLNGLTTVFEEFYVSNNPLLNLTPTSLTDCYELSVSTISSLNLSGLLRSKRINISEISNFTGLSNLTSCEYLYIYGINNVSTLNFPSLLSAYLSITGNPSLTSISFPVLSSGGVSINGNPLLTSLALPVLTSGGVGISETSLTSIALPVFSSGNVTISNNPVLTSIALPVFSSSSYSVIIEQNPVLSSIALPALTSTNEIKIDYNPLLTSIAFPSLTSNSGIYLNSNALTTSNINSLLNKMLTVSPTVPKNIQLSAQTPPAPPSGQGIIDKQTLINAGNYVITD